MTDGAFVEEGGDRGDDGEGGEEKGGLMWREGGMKGEGI